LSGASIIISQLGIEMQQFKAAITA